jgi:hypothetical protein
VRFQILSEVTIQVNVLCKIIPRDHLTTVMMQAAISSQTLVHAYQSKRHCRPEEVDEGRIE